MQSIRPEQLRAAALAVGLADPSITRIARAAGVCEASVSRILSKGPQAAPKAAARVLAALGLAPLSTP